MESHHLSPPHGDLSRPSLGFPLGTALLLFVIFSLSGIFSCCYHWDKLQFLRRSSSNHIDLEADNVDHSNLKAMSTYKDIKQSKIESLPVIMPGDQIAKFIALPCPCEQYRPENIIVEIQKPSKAPPIGTAVS